MRNRRSPRTFLEAVEYFADRDHALQFVVDLRWPNGPTCSRCSSTDVSFLSTRRLWKCRACQKQFSAKVGTIFEDSPIGLEKWLPVLWMLVNGERVSSYELARTLRVTQKTAWFMLHRIRLAVRTPSFRRLKGWAVVDDTFIMGSPRARWRPSPRATSLTRKTWRAAS
jgi:transposase-like protein